MPHFVECLQNRIILIKEAKRQFGIIARNRKSGKSPMGFGETIPLVTTMELSNQKPATEPMFLCRWARSNEHEQWSRAIGLGRANSATYANGHANNKMQVRQLWSRQNTKNNQRTVDLGSRGEKARKHLVKGQ